MAETILIAEYARRARDTDELNDKPPYSLDAPFIGLVGEVGSLLSAAKKLARSDRGFTSFQKTAREELGNLFWYITIVCDRCLFDQRDLLSEAVGAADLAMFEGCNGDIADPETVEATVPSATLIELNTRVVTLSQVFPACRSEDARVEFPLELPAAVLEVKAEVLKERICSVAVEYPGRVSSLSENTVASRQTGLRRHQGRWGGLGRTSYDSVGGYSAMCPLG